MKYRCIAIPKASKPDHLRDNVGTVGWRLSDEDFKKLSATFQTAKGIAK